MINGIITRQAAPSTAYQSCVHTDPSAKSEEFQTNSPRQEELAVLTTEYIIVLETTGAGMWFHPSLKLM